jgi:hypothetical protein
MASIHDEYRQLLKETLPATTVDRLLFTWRRLSEEERIDPVNRSDWDRGLR